MPSLSATLADLTPTDTGFTIKTPEAWSQGRTLYGGMTAALLHESVRRAHGDLGPLRSAQFTFVGPSTGPLALSTELLRKGRSSAIVAADCRATDGVSARATFGFGAPRDSAIAHDRLPRPGVPDPETSAPFHRSTKPLPGFLGQFEMRLAHGTRLFQPGQPPEFAVWSRFREPHGSDPVTALLAIADALPCAAMANFPKLAPVSTLSWQIDLLPPPDPIDGWVLVSTSSEQAADGYSLQAMRAHDRAGRPLAVARQVVAIFA